jgi:RHS repeat-associated protein
MTLVVEINSAGTILATNTFGADGLVSRNTTGSGATAGVGTSGSVFYVFDDHGNTTGRYAPGAGTQQLDFHLYDAWGGTVPTPASDGTPSTVDPWDGPGAKYGGYTDHETGLTLHGHRYYDPSRGRWINRDPIGTGGGLDLYAYCLNRPTVLSDAVGWSPEEPTPEPAPTPPNWGTAPNPQPNTPPSPGTVPPGWGPEDPWPPGVLPPIVIPNPNPDAPPGPGYPYIEVEPSPHYPDEPHWQTFIPELPNFPYTPAPAPQPEPQPAPGPAPQPIVRPPDEQVPGTSPPPPGFDDPWEPGSVDGPVDGPVGAPIKIDCPFDVAV